MKRILFAIFMMTLIASCSNSEQTIEAVQNFDVNRYMGKWYEIARLDFRFERNLINTTADYTLSDNGTVRVENRGFDTLKNEWSLAIGKAKLVGKKQEAMLKVSFFGPFYSPYTVIAIDPQYKTALVAGKNLKYLWILSRTTTIDETTKQGFLKVAEDYGYVTKNLIWVKQDE